MVRLSATAVAGGALWQAAATLASPAPAKLEDVEKRAITCAFSGSNVASSASKSKTSCSTIIPSSVAVSSGNACFPKVIFEGETTFMGRPHRLHLWHLNHRHRSRWWDGEGSNGGKTKSTFFYAHGMKSSSIAGIYIQSSPVQVFSIDGPTDLALTEIMIDNSNDDANGAANTDAFDIGGSTGITISGANVHNQDDCIAVNSGTAPGSRTPQTSPYTPPLQLLIHSARPSIVHPIGVRIKTVYGATSSVTGVTYKDITLSDITGYGIDIEQGYENGSPTGTLTTGVPVTDITLDNVKGTVASTGTDIYILCSSSGRCSDWTWENVSVTGGKTSTGCENVSSGESC
ncbi:glycoside hydrolase family 28 protein [Lepidopterella palustris CBS 459.81]|uniref:endo-polygalacturonase n=1 Tax=Lepidopterella palustris CBS 459.81 TaxID=1314670 RepID=A0A8E2EAT5_9PEZI|nr:glycoside hydrolase family 28 protein [Lepidopterella palustris CBS 459.81]